MVFALPSLASLITANINVEILLRPISIDKNMKENNGQWINLSQMRKNSIQTRKTTVFLTILNHCSFIT
jgi:hypothetical protein